MIQETMRIMVDSVAACFGITTANMEREEVEVWLDVSLDNNAHLFDMCVTLSEQLTQARLVAAALSVILVSVLVAAIFI